MLDTDHGGDTGLCARIGSSTGDRERRDDDGDMTDTDHGEDGGPCARSGSSKGTGDRERRGDLAHEGVRDGGTRLGGGDGERA